MIFKGTSTMNTAKILAAVAALTTATSAVASSITVDNVAQRWPWNNKIDITYTVSGGQDVAAGVFARIVFTAHIDDGEQTFTEEAEAAYELWVGARYDLKDPNEDFLHTFMEETTYPDCFVIRIDPAPYGGLNLYYGEDAELQPGDLSVILKADGQTLSGDGWHMEKAETVYDEGTLYAYALVIPRPESLPEHGTAEVYITRKLIHYPATVSTEMHTVEY